jgi:hypothetical protein
MQIATTANGCEMRGAQWLFFQPRGARGDTLPNSGGFAYALKIYNRIPLFGAKGGQGIPKPTFGLLVKWAVSLLGDKNNQFGVEQRWPRQYVGGLRLAKQVRYQGTTTESVRELIENINSSRKDRSHEPRETDCDLFSGPMIREITLDCVTLTWDPTDDTWKFDVNEIPIEVAVRFAVRVLRDVRTRRDWFPYYVPWLADEDELQRASSGAGESRDVDLSVREEKRLLAINSACTVGILGESRGFRIVAVQDRQSEEDEIEGEFPYEALSQQAPAFRNWSELVDSLSDLAAELANDGDQFRTGSDSIPSPKLFLYRSGAAKSVPLKVENRAAMQARYPLEERKSRSWLCATLTDSVGVPVLLWEREGLSIVMKSESDGSFSITDSSGSAPVVTGLDLLYLLALVISDPETAKERPLQYAEWMRAWYERSAGDFRPQRSPTSDAPPVSKSVAPRENSRPIIRIRIHSLSLQRLMLRTEDHGAETPRDPELSRIVAAAATAITGQAVASRAGE